MPVQTESRSAEALTPSEIVQLAGGHFAARDPDRWTFVRLALAAVAFAAAGVALSRLTGQWFGLALIGLWLPLLLIAGVMGTAATRQWRTGFPGKKNSLLLDGETWVSTRQFVGVVIKSALAANERAGAITLALDGNGDTPRVLAIPSDEGAPPWHHATLEQRLELRGSRPVAEIVHEWLGRDSPNPWHRAIDQTVTMLRVRGIATPRPRRWYQTERFSVVEVPAGTIRDVTALLADMQRDRPGIWSGLDDEIATAISQRTRAAQKSSDGSVEDTPSPWLDERAEDRQRLGQGPPVAVVVPVWGSLVILAVMTGVAAYVADRYQAWPLAIGTAAVASMIAFWLSRLSRRRPDLSQVLWRRAVEWQLRQRGEAGRGEVIEAPVIRPMSTAESIAGSLVVVPIVTTLVVSLYMTDLRPLLLPAAGVGIWMFFKFRAAVARAIGDAVLQPPRASDHTPVAQPAPTPAAAPAAAPPLPSASPLRLEILDMRTPGSLPAPSAASQARLDAVRQRPLTMRAHFRAGVIVAAVYTTALALAGWSMGASLFPFTTVVLALVTIIGVGSAGSARIRAAVAGVAARMVLGQGVSVGGGEIDEGAASPRPLALSFAFGAWVALASMAAAALAQAPVAPLVARSAAATGLIGIILFLFWFQRRRRAIERAFPSEAPQQLLALRVFGSPHLADFLDLTNEWQWIGVRLRLDGPGTAGHKLRDLMNFAVGRLDRSIVDDENELSAALADFRYQPDKRLRFPVNSIQCHDLVWKTAVDQLLDRADAVVMDLASLGPHNQGVAYELGRLFAGLDLSRIVLLIDDSTDRAVLHDLVARAWASMPAQSPNAALEQPSLRVFDMGGGADRKPEESRVEWQRRQVRPSDRRRLVGLLVDASLPPRSRAGAPRAQDPATVQWSRTPIPAPVRLLRNVVFAVFLLFQVLTIAC